MAMILVHRIVPEVFPMGRTEMTTERTIDCAITSDAVAWIQADHARTLIHFVDGTEMCVAETFYKVRDMLYAT